MSGDKFVQSIVDKDSLPDNYPTHRHDAYFWECLGRTVATFGFLEEVLCRAIYAFTATKPCNEEEFEEEYEKMIVKLERSISDQLGGLIDTFGKAVRDNPNSTIENLENLLTKLRKASKTRNVLCHGSWKAPDKKGASIPFFVNRQKEIFETSINTSYLQQVQKHSTELICEVINCITHMGWQFPGSFGPGKTI